ncbi:MAG: DUF3488 and transglutaminase-like domain-containing protein [Pyrinomonadaceae bacterium]
MTFNTYFRISSYAMVASGALALAVSGGLSPLLALAFAVVLALSWNLEGRRWQLSERVGLFVVLLSLPLFYLDWKYQTSIGEATERVGVSALAHLILFLSSVKLFQVKANRDWVFLYLISFFEILLAAGLSVSPVFLLTLGLYVLVAVSTVVSFEIRKARRVLKAAETRLLVAPDSTLFRRLTKRHARGSYGIARRLPLVAATLLLLIFLMALPLFFIAPRSGASALTRAGSGLAGFIGFSDNVTLGAIGRLQQSNNVVMHVRVEDADGQTVQRGNLRWRGIALDEFNGHGWKRTRVEAPAEQTRNERGFYQFGTTEGLHRLTTQTFFLEPLDSPVLFAAPRVIAVQGSFPFVRRDREGSLSTRSHEFERITYKAFSDTTEPDEDTLRADLQPYTRNSARYLQLPSDLDPRIASLAQKFIAESRARNRYDAARVIEYHLQNDYGYTLELKAKEPEPLSDFLFNVREGHCEYFATAMAVMLRTQGIAARVVNGFQVGEYNDTADVYTVRQSNAHSWVEVYFPQTDSWVTFDPTPSAGRTTPESTGLQASLSKYAEAFELLWTQYVVGYDRQEQRSLATSLRNSLFDYRRTFAETVSDLKSLLNEFTSRLRGDGGSAGSTLAKARFATILLAIIFAPLLFAFLIRRIARLGFWRAFKFWQKEARQSSVIEFYERMTRSLAARGIERAADQTPLEFATVVSFPEALKITRAYNSVRYGEQQLTPGEQKQIEEWLRSLEGTTSK